MNKEFVPYEESLALKELGFDEPCICGYNAYQLLRNKFSSSIDGDFVRWDEKYDKDLKAPLYQQVFRWFREKHKLPSYIGHYGINGYSFVIDFTDNRNLQFRAEYKYYTYEEAELSCLKKLIELVKENK